MTATQGQRLVGDRYALGPTIGVGGMAEVFLATDTRLGRSVAVKVLRADLARDPAFHARFRREAQAAASLSAPSIVSVFDTGEDDPGGVPWIVMEHVPGRTLREVLDEDGRLLPERALEVVADVCAALGVAHAAGIVHRDVKPANVMLTRAGEVKVMDFGIARAAASASSTMTQTAAVIGTAAYLSPEQARGEHVDARSDVYSTGCLLYELLTGTPPFTGDSPVAVAYQHVREDPVPPSRRDPALPVQVDAVVLTALAKNPANRYQTAAEMREDLLRAAAGGRVQAPAVLLPRPAPGGSSRRAVAGRRVRRTALLAVATLVALAALAGLALGVQRLVDDAPALVGTPDVVGLTRQQARLELEDVRLEVGAVRQEFSTRPDGSVLTQQPRAGTPLEPGASVALVLSRGVEQVVVPRVVGVRREEAVRALRAARLVLVQVTERDSASAPGTVLEVLPAVGTRLPVGREVRLVLSTGRTLVPDVVGTGRTRATRALEGAGFLVEVRRRSDPGPAGLVLAQTPRGTAVRGATVVLTVSRRPPPVPPPAPTLSATLPAPSVTQAPTLPPRRRIPVPTAGPTPVQTPTGPGPAPTTGPAPGPTSAAPSPATPPPEQAAG